MTQKILFSILLQSTGLLPVYYRLNRIGGNHDDVDTQHCQLGEYIV